MRRICTSVRWLGSCIWALMKLKQRRRSNQLQIRTWWHLYRDYTQLRTIQEYRRSLKWFKACTILWRKDGMRTPKKESDLISSSWSVISYEERESFTRLLKKISRLRQSRLNTEWRRELWCQNSIQIQNYFPFSEHIWVFAIRSIKSWLNTLSKRL